ncbi:MAG: methionine adenosyltransferase [Acholeplasmataceae bacterium]
MTRYFSSEAVTEGHPDKVCDLISDAILDACLEQDPHSRVACETAIAKDFVLIFGEITSRAKVDYAEIARRTIRGIGYGEKGSGFDLEAARIDVRINRQSRDIAQGVDRDAENGLGAGDQGLMFGYATDETKEYMPLPIALAQRIARRLSYVRKHQLIEGLGPDGKTQVTVAYENGEPRSIENVVLSTQHHDDVKLDGLKIRLINDVIAPVLSDYDTTHTTYRINPTGRFVTGGPEGDSGMTGRKIIVDTYGGYARHGGGAFSGKDATKVDRTAAYMARYLAKNIVAAKLARSVEIQLAYAIGVTEPVSIDIDTFDTGIVASDRLRRFILEHFDLSPKGMIERLGLRRPIFARTTCYGHFGREEKEFTWEKLDSVELFARLRYNVRSE